MGQSNPFRTRDRSRKTFLTAEECAQRAAELMAEVNTIKAGSARQTALEEACNFRMLAEMKRRVSSQVGTPDKTSPRSV